MAASAAMVGAPVSPVEPPTTKTLPEENLVEVTVRRGTSRSTPPPIRPASGRPGPPRGIPMSISSTSPANPLPGRTNRPGLARWNVAVATARTASPATSPGEPSTPLGTSAAPAARHGGGHDRGLGCVERVDHAGHGVARLAGEAGPEHGIDDHVRAVE